MSMTIEKEAACAAIDKESKALRALSLDIWDHPELCFEEHHAHEVITDFLEERGFQVERKYKLDTAFRATACSQDVSADCPHIGLMCEYDALPGIGHACGHNLICILALATALGIKEALDKFGLKGKEVDDFASTIQLTVLGTPAEEGGGGKIDLINAGAFGDLDIAMMAHPYAHRNIPKPACPALQEVDVTFEGLASHAAMGPWEGVNALDAAVLCYQSVACLRHQLKPTWRVHGVFTNAGEKPSIIPALAGLKYYARTASSKDMQILKAKLIGCFHGAAAATGCKVTYAFNDKGYEAVLANEVLLSLYVQNGANAGVEFEADPEKLSAMVGSTDMGNVSYVLPSIHPSFGLHTDSPCHTVSFRDAARTEESHQTTLQHSKVMAMTAIDVYQDATLVTKMKESFQAQLALEK